mgnify:CR=1 FL=1
MLNFDTLKIGDLIARKEHGELKYYIVLDIGKNDNGRNRIKKFNIKKQSFGGWQSLQLDQYRLAEEWIK